MGIDPFDMKGPKDIPSPGMPALSSGSRGKT